MQSKTHVLLQRLGAPDIHRVLPYLGREIVTPLIFARAGSNRYWPRFLRLDAIYRFAYRRPDGVVVAYFNRLESDEDV
jgi:hypothetical protein